MKSLSKKTSGSDTSVSSSVSRRPRIADIQKKLKVNTPGDAYEIEADRVADQIVNLLSGHQGSASETTRPEPLSRTLTPLTQRKTEEDIQSKEEDTIQQKESEISNMGMADPIKEEDPIRKEKVQAKEEENVQRDEEENIQNKEEESVQLQEEDVQLNEEETPVQTKCAECESREKQGIQAKCDKCGSATVQLKEKNEVFPEIPKADKKQTEMPAGQTVKEPAKRNSDNQKGESFDISFPQVPEEIEPPASLQTKKENTLPAPVQESDLSAQLRLSKGKGNPMSPGILLEMNTAFGVDFSNVRIHTDTQSVEMNRKLGAHAFTNGNDIYFNQGKYAPETTEGKRLLAHELAHTIQQGAVSSIIQRYIPVVKTVNPEPAPPKPDDGGVMKGKADSKIDNNSDVQEGKNLSQEEKEKLKNPPRNEVRSERGAVEKEGVTTPPVDRGKIAEEKTSKEKKELKGQVNASKKEEKDKEAKGKNKGNNVPKKKMSPEEQAKKLEEEAKALPEPEAPAAYVHPVIQKPVDSVGEDLPRRPEMDTQVRGLGYITEMLRQKGYETQLYAFSLKKKALGLMAVVWRQKADMANAVQGTNTIEAHNTARKEKVAGAKTDIKDSEQRQQFVAKEAPVLLAEAKVGQADSGALAGDAKAKSNRAKSELPDDPDGRKEAKEQNKDIDKTASGAASIDEAIVQAGERAKGYMLDAEQAAKDNQESQAGILATENLVQKISARVAEMKAFNKQGQLRIKIASKGPVQMKKDAENSMTEGSELIDSTKMMETELIDIQSQYLNTMRTIESKEAAEKRIKEESKNNPPPDLTPEQQELAKIADMSEKEQDEYIQGLSENKKQALTESLNQMIQETEQANLAPDDGTFATEGERKQVQAIKLKEDPFDPRQEQIDKVDAQRSERVGKVMDVADTKMNFLTAAQQKMLASKLVAESVTDDIKSISIYKMGKDMIEGMIDPRIALQGAFDGAAKIGSGFANLFNADAWKKDPLGNLLQIGADITTGLAQIFTTILSVAGLITAILVALVILSWGALAVPLAPAFSWMGTIFTYGGWGAIITGVLSMRLNSLAYMKNLHDAGAAPTARAFFGNTEQMKKNTMDGFTGAMSVVAGVGAAKMGPAMKGPDFAQAIPKGIPAFARSIGRGIKGGFNKLKNLPANIISGLKKLAKFGKKELVALKNKIKGLFKKKDKTDIDNSRDLTPDEKRKIQNNQDVVNRGKTEDGHELRVDKDGNVAECSTCELFEVSHRDVLDKHPDMAEELRNIRKRMAASPDSPQLMTELNNFRTKLLKYNKRSHIATFATDLIEPKIVDIKKVAPDGRVGYRGSLATGKKYSTNGKFQTSDWDVDAFIVSDKLANEIPLGINSFRSGSKNPTLRNISKDIDASLRTIPGYRTDKPFTFRVFSKKEFQRIEGKYVIL